MGITSVRQLGERMRRGLLLKTRRKELDLKCGSRYFGAPPYDDDGPPAFFCFTHRKLVGVCSECGRRQAWVQVEIRRRQERHFDAAGAIDAYLRAQTLARPADERSQIPFPA